MAQEHDTMDRRRSWILRLCLASAAGVALSVLALGFAHGFDAGLLMFSAVTLIPMAPALGLRLAPTRARTAALLGTSVVFVVGVWAMLLLATLESLVIIGLWNGLVVFGLPASILILLVLSLQRASGDSSQANG